MSSSGTHVWFDLMSSDTDASLAFYSELIGYGRQPFDGPMPYEMFTVGDQPIGGVMQLSDEAKAMGAPPHWVGYVGVDDIAAKCAQVAELGGAVLKEPTEIPKTGRFAIVRDPQGAVFAMYQNANPDEDQGSTDTRVGDVSWCELMTTDYDNALDFYGALFGWRRTEAMDMGEGWMYQMFGTDKTFGGAMNKNAQLKDAPTAWLYYLHVGDVNATLEKAKQLGASVINGPMEVPGGDLVAQLVDPQGAAFAIHGAKA